MTTTGLPAGRYGERDRLGRRGRAVVLGGLGVVVVGVAAWFGLASADEPVTWQEVGFTLGEEEVGVVFEVDRPDPSVPVTCVVEALNERYGQVGVREVDVPAATGRTVRVTTAVRISEPAVTGVVQGCAPADGG